MKYLKKISYLSVFTILVCAGFASQASGQDRPRVVKPNASRAINPPPSAAANPVIDKTRSLSSSMPTAPSNSPAARPVLTNKITIAENPLVKKTGDTNPINQLASLAANKTVYNQPISYGLMRGIQSKLGIRYSYGSSGPNRYDCSGFVWAVFNDAGINLTRQSARSLWALAEPVSGDERYKFGTLVFLNGLGHIGIVADENGFYHASSSKGITYSPFKGYWEKRIVGFKRLRAAMPVADAAETANQQDPR